MDNNNENKGLRQRIEKVFFTSGDLVTIKHDLPNKPVMMVQTVDKSPIKSDDSIVLLGVTCIWFSADYVLQKHRFNTKDIQKYSKDIKKYSND